MKGRQPMSKRKKGYKLYLSVVDPLDTGVRSVGELTYELPIEARNRLTEPCPQCGKEHEILYVVYRVLVDTLGNFPVFRVNGSELVVDTSLPTGVLSVPADAERLDPEEAAKAWHASGDFHEFGVPG
jgi:hypothetical protein